MIAGLATACGGDGVYIEVKVPAAMSATAVDLYLGASECTTLSNGDDCTAIAPPSVDGTRREIDGEVHFVDSVESFQSIVEDGSAFFFLEGKGAVKSAIAVGHDANDQDTNTGVVIFRRIDLDKHARVIAELEPVAARRLGGTAPAVEIWASPDNAYRCIGADVGGRQLFIVPTDDPDCDQVAAPECAPAAHLGVEPPSSLLDEQSCAVISSNSVCVLGDIPCDETAGASGCVEGAITYCVPTSVCGCASFNDDCIDSLIDPDPLNGNTKTRIACIIEVEAGGSTFRTCVDKQPTEIELVGHACDFPEIAALSRDQFDGFAATFPIPGASNNASITPTLVGPLCRFGLLPPNAQFGSAVPPPLHTMIKLDMTPATPGQNLMLIPLDVVFIASDCAAAAETSCRLLLDPVEKITKCGLPP